MEEELKCPSCRQFLRDPVLLHCAHSYCRECALNSQVRCSSLAQNFSSIPSTSRLLPPPVRRISMTSPSQSSSGLFVYLSFIYFFSFHRKIFRCLGHSFSYKRLRYWFGRGKSIDSQRVRQRSGRLWDFFWGKLLQQQKRPCSFCPLPELWSVVSSFTFYFITCWLWEISSYLSFTSFR